MVSEKPHYKTVKLLGSHKGFIIGFPCVLTGTHTFPALPCTLFPTISAVSTNLPRVTRVVCLPETRRVHFTGSPSRTVPVFARCLKRSAKARCFCMRMCLASERCFSFSAEGSTFNLCSSLIEEITSPAGKTRGKTWKSPGILNVLKLPKTKDLSKRRPGVIHLYS